VASGVFAGHSKAAAKLQSHTALQHDAGADPLANFQNPTSWQEFNIIFCCTAIHYLGID
jgi:hypothetical protein